MFDTADDLIAQLKISPIASMRILSFKDSIPQDVQYTLKDGTILLLDFDEWRRFEDAQKKDNQRPIGTDQVQDKAAIG